MNFYTWSKPPAADVNVWEEMGNPGWNWRAYVKYTLRAEECVALVFRSRRTLHESYQLYGGHRGPTQRVPARA